MKLSLKEVAKRFDSARGSHWAVRDVSLEIEDGEFFVMLGPSGCGKSTVLNIVAGLEKPTSGEIWFGDQLVASTEHGLFRSPRERNVSMVFQSYALYPHLTVFENIAFPLRIARQQNALVEEAVRRVSVRLGIERLLLARPGELSGGQRQRVAIARAIVRQPSVFLLDEPLSNLDAQLRAATRAELKTLQRSLGVTTLYVTHDQAEALGLGDTIAVLREGRVEQVGPPAELYERPANAFVAQFLVSPPMNLLRAVIRQEGETVWACVGAQRLRVDSNGATRLLKHGREACLLGLRPDRLTLGSRENLQPLRARIVGMETLGREMQIRCAVDSEEILVSSTDTLGSSLTVGEALTLGVDMGEAYFFRVEDRQQTL